jgi:hypothetical protein
MPQLVLKLDSTIRAGRILHAVLLLAALLNIFMAEVFSHHEPHDVHVIWVGFLVNGLLLAGIALYFRIWMLATAAEILRTKPEDQFALARWRFGNILSFVLAESIVLFGFALRFIGGTSLQSLPFYIAGIAMMILWFPRRPGPKSSSKPSA